MPSRFVSEDPAEGLNCTLIDLISNRTSKLGDRTAFRFLGTDGSETASFRYDELGRRVFGAASLLQHRFAPNTVLLLALPTSPAAVVATLGAICAGLVPALLPLPKHVRDRRSLLRLAAVAARTKNAVLCSTAQGLSVLGGGEDDVAALVKTALCLDDTLGEGEPAAEWRRPDLTSDSPAYLQFTSGSTSTPRGVVLTHGNLLSNLELIASAFGNDERMVGLGWAPLYHDMGFVGHVLEPLFVGGTSVLAPPAWFTRNPLGWLAAIDRYGVTVSGGPPFAYDACLRQLERGGQEVLPPLASLDLSLWRTAYAGAEPVSAALMSAFADRFAAHGLRREALFPCYGLAEATLLVAGSYLGGAQGSSTEIRYRVPEPLQIRIVEPGSGKEVPPGDEGEVLVAGPAVAAGYLNDAAATAAAFFDEGGTRWLRTGDLGRLRERDLHISGRLKDVIIVRGANLHAIDVEEAVRATDTRLRHEAIAAVASPGLATEGLIIAAEVKLRPGADGQADAESLRQIVSEAVTADFGVSPERVLLVRRGVLPRTTSGKLMRSAVRAAILTGQLGELPAAKATQMKGQGGAPIAIVGMACRFPGADDPEAFWGHLAGGTDLVGEVPRDRWNADDHYAPQFAVPGKMNTRWGGFIEGADLFDAGFFGIAPQEAAEMDPQQRILLEVCWRAFEHAGLVPEDHAGSATGVFVGISTNDYLQLQIRMKPGMDRYNAYSGLGIAVSIAANRLSYTFDLRGPSVAMDTACSSSLTAIHVAVQSLRQMECDAAMAGGVNLILSPWTTVALSQFGMTSPEGRCKVFDTLANGYVRAEGAGFVVLKRFEDAIRDGDRVLAVIRGSAIGQDGHSQGITAPNPEAQAWLIRRALADAGCYPGEITFVEAHGTGTAVGDPAEINEVKRIYGLAPGGTCFVGSVKASVGHLEAAAGVASLVKVVEAIRHAAIPPQLHFTEMNPRIQLVGTRMRVPTKLTPWNTPGEARIAAISSFGFGGANAHLIVSSPPPPEAVTPTEDARGPWLVPLSGREERSLTDYVRALRRHLDREDPPSVADVAYTLAVRRSHFARRGFVVASSSAELAGGLEGWLADHARSTDALPSDVSATGVAFLFSGQGSQRPAMGRELHSRFQAFRSAFDRCAEAFASVCPEARPLADIVFGVLGIWGEDRTDLDTAALLQPALFAVEYATAALWRSFGVVPAAVLGHSLGEIAAACIAGCLTPEDGMALVTLRGQIMARVVEPGAMAAVALGAKEVGELLATSGLERVTVAAFNAPGSVALAGPEALLTQALEIFSARGVAARRLKTPQAFHSALMDPILDDFADAARNISFSAPAIPFVSNVTGALRAEAPDAAYWRRHLREPVRFEEGVEALLRKGIRYFVEVGPGDALLKLVRRHAVEEHPLLCVPSLGDGPDEAATLLRSVGQLYVHGAALSFAAVQADPPEAAALRRPIGELPGHPFHRERYWFTAGPATEITTAGAPIDGLPDADWVHDVKWERAPLRTGAENALKDPDQGFLVVGDGRGLGAALAHRLRGSHKDVYHLLPSPSLPAHHTFQRGADKKSGVVRLLLPEEASVSAFSAALSEILNRLARAGVKRWTLIDVAALDATPTPTLSAAALDADQRRIGPGALTALARAVVRTALGIRVWLVTRGAQATSDDGAIPVEVSQAPIWGFGVTLFLEHPEMRGGLIDLDPHSPHEGAENAVLAAVGADDNEPLIAFRGGVRLVPRLVPLALPPPSALIELSSEGSYLVTGGLGGLGLRSARWLAERGAGQVILLGRRGLPAREEWDAASLPLEVKSAVETIRAMEAMGTKVTVVAADVTDGARLRALASELDTSGLPLRGVIHAAGVNWYSRIADMDLDRLTAAMRIKVSAAWTLHELTQNRPTDLFVLFSSVSALWGSVELAHYTAANHFLDALAAHRRRLGLPALCIDWGPWSAVGMSARSDVTAVVTRVGFRLIAPHRAIRVMEALVSAGVHRAVVADIAWDVFQAFIAFSASPALFSHFRRSEHLPAAPGATGQKVSDTIRNEAPGRALAVLVSVVRQELATVLLIPYGREPELQKRFNLMGMDSLMAIAFALRLEGIAGQRLPTTLAYNYPNILEVSRHLYQLIRGETAPLEPGPFVGLATSAPSPKEAPRGAPSPAPSRTIAPSGPEAWFPHYNADTPPASAETPVLFCLPQAGSGASLYEGWKKALADVATVVSVQLPGREDRSGEAPASDMKSLVAGLVDALDARFFSGGRRPNFVVLGHSLGGLVAFELARALRRRKLPLPGLLMLSACALPPKEEIKNPMHALEDAAFRARASESFALAPEIVSNEKVWQAVLPMLRADVRILETYRPAAEPPLAIPFVLIGGREDPLVPKDRWLAWDSQTAAEVSFHLMPGGHAALWEDPARTEAILRASLGAGRRQ